MSEVLFLITVTGREKLSAFLSLYRGRGAEIHHVTLGRGTAVSTVLNVLGLSDSEKAVCFSVVTDIVWKSIKKDLENRLQIDVPGTGVAFTVPVSSVGGKRELMFLTEGQHFVKGEESTLKDTTQDLIVAVCSRGFSETVMDAARSAGAGGGTVVSAKGTGMEHAEKFFGVTLASEKDMILIVTPKEKKNGIMEAIIRQAGPSTRAKAIAFSLPVTDTAGMRLLNGEENETAAAAPAEEK